MATNASRAIRKRDACNGWGERLSPYLSILVNNIELSGKAVEGVDPFFIVRVLMEKGNIIYDNISGNWVEFQTVGRLNREYMPRAVQLFNGEYYTNTLQLATYKNLHVYPSNPEHAPLIELIKQKTYFIQRIENAIDQRLDVLAKMCVAVTNDSATSTQIRLLNYNRQNGAGFGIYQKTDEQRNGINGENPFDVYTLGADGVQNDLLIYRDLKNDYLTQLYEIVGVTQMGEKNERRVNGEIDIAYNSAGTIIDLICATINKYAKYYGDDIHAERKGIPASVNDIEKENKQKNIEKEI